MEGDAEKQLPPLYTFVDEGGNLDFSPTGTKYFTITSATVARPFPLEADLSELRFDLLERGVELEYFHATEDLQKTRNEVFALIQANVHRYRVDSVIVEKRKTGPALQELDQFYPRMLGYLLRYLVNGTDWTKWSELVVVTDRIPINKKKKAVEKAIKKTLAKVLPGNIRYRLLHWDSKSTINLQVADYFNWAIYKKWAAKDRRSYDLVSKVILSEFDIFWSGTTHYY